MWNWAQSSELQCLAHLHSELGGGATWCLSGRKAPGNGLCPGLKPPTLAGSHTLSQVQNPRLRSGGPHVLLQAQSGAGGRWVTFTLCMQCGNASQAPEVPACSAKSCRTEPANADAQA